jgi:hypothetical protein
MYFAHRTVEATMADKNPKRERPGLVSNEEGAIGYIAAWLLGVPASVLFIIFLMRGCT